MAYGLLWETRAQKGLHSPGTWGSIGSLEVGLETEGRFGAFFINLSPRELTITPLPVCLLHELSIRV